MQSENRQTSANYLHRVLESGARLFLYRSRVRSLLGAPGWDGETLSYPPVLLPVAFKYADYPFMVNPPAGKPFTGNIPGFALRNFQNQPNTEPAEEKEGEEQHPPPFVGTHHFIGGPPDPREQHTPPSGHPSQEGIPGESDGHKYKRHEARKDAEKSQAAKVVEDKAIETRQEQNTSRAGPAASPDLKTAGARVTEIQLPGSTGNTSHSKKLPELKTFEERASETKLPDRIETMPGPEITDEQHTPPFVGMYHFKGGPPGPREQHTPPSGHPSQEGITGEIGGHKYKRHEARKDAEKSWAAKIAEDKTTDETKLPDRIETMPAPEISGEQHTPPIVGTHRSIGDPPGPREQHTPPSGHPSQEGIPGEIGGHKYKRYEARKDADKSQAAKIAEDKATDETRLPDRIETMPGPEITGEQYTPPFVGTHRFIGDPPGPREQHTPPSGHPSQEGIPGESGGHKYKRYEARKDAEKSQAAKIAEDKATDETRLPDRIETMPGPEISSEQHTPPIVGTHRFMGGPPGPREQHPPPSGHPSQEGIPGESGGHKYKRYEARKDAEKSQAAKIAEDKATDTRPAQNTSRSGPAASPALKTAGARVAEIRLPGSPEKSKLPNPITIHGSKKLQEIKITGERNTDNQEPAPSMPAGSQEEWNPGEHKVRPYQGIPAGRRGLAGFRVHRELLDSFPERTGARHEHERREAEEVRMVSPSYRDAVLRIEQLRQEVHRLNALNAKMSSPSSEAAKSGNGNKERGNSELIKEDPAQHAELPPQPPVIIRQSSRQPQRKQIPCAFWERSYLGRFHLRTLR